MEKNFQKQVFISKFDLMIGKFLFYFVVIGKILSLNGKEEVLMNFLQFC